MAGLITRRAVRLLAAAGVSLLLAGHAYGFGEPVHSKVDVSSKTQGDKVVFTFKVVPNEKMKVTFDNAPWKLDVKDSAGNIAFAKATYPSADLDDKLPGYVVTSEKAAKPEGEVEYSLVSFICTVDQTSCYREVHKGKHKWQAAVTKASE